MISIVIPVYNNHEYTEQCVKSIEKTTNMNGCEIIIVDNGSNPAVTILKTATIRNEENLGFAKAINQGISTAKNNIVCILNNDTIMTKGWADRMYYYLAFADVVVPTTNYALGMQQCSIGAYGTEDELQIASEDNARNKEHQCQEVNWAIGLCMMFPKSLWKDVGGFDERFLVGNSEDIDFCVSVKERGGSIVIAKDVYIHHFGSRTFAAMKVDYPALIRENRQRLLGKWGDTLMNKYAGQVNE